MNAEIEGLLRNYKQGNVIIPSFFKKLKRDLLSSQGCLPLLCVPAPGKLQKQKEIGKKRNLELGDPESRLKNRSRDVSFQNIFKRHLFFQHEQFPSRAQEVHRVSHSDCPWVFQSKILSKEG